MAKSTKYVYFFGDGKADGNGSMKELLGGKGANLAEMAGHSNLRLPVPPGFTITTEVCTYYYEHGRKYPAELSADSSPSDVAGVLIRALEEEDMATLLGLVAVKAESEAFEAIFRRHGREARTDYSRAAAMTAAGWGMSYGFVQNGSTEIVNESVDGDKAVVHATGTLQGGDACKLRIKLVREDAVWKVRAGIETDKP